MPGFLLPLAIMAGSAIAGGLSNRGSKQTSTSKTNENFDNWQTPQYDDQSNFLKNTILSRYLDLIQGDDGEYWDAYKLKGLRDINDAEDQSNNILRQIMSQRGLSLTSGGSAPFMQSAIASQMTKGNLLSQIPLLQDERRRNTLKEASGFFSTLPYSVHRTGTGSSTGEGVGTMPGNVAGGTITGLISSLAQLYGAGAFGDSASPMGAGSGSKVNYNIVPQGYKLPGVR